MSREALERDDHRYVWHPFTQMRDWLEDTPLVIDHAEGNFLFDADGKRYLDGVSSLWVILHGHRKREIEEAITRQMGKVAHTTFLGLTHGPGVELARRLVEIAPPGLGRVFYSDTGAAAVEIALKMAFQYWQQRPDPRPKKTKFLSLTNGYHGDTIGAMSVSGIDRFQSTYGPVLIPTIKVPSAYCYRCHLGKEYPSCEIACLRDVERALHEHADEIAAVIMEPRIQGAGGMIAFPPGYTKGVWELAKKHDVLFIADEVATGFGRTGQMFACLEDGVRPDLMVLGKGISGGYLPLAVTMATEEIFQAFLGGVDEGKTFYHGHTYSGNPLACAAAIANLDIFRKEGTLPELGPKIEAMAKGLERFRGLEHVGDVRQAGLMVGIELVKDWRTKEPYGVNERVGQRVALEARKRGVLLRPLGDVIVLMPPLSVSKEEMSMLLDAAFLGIAAVTGGRVDFQ